MLVIKRAIAASLALVGGCIGREYAGDVLLEWALPTTGTLLAATIATGTVVIGHAKTQPWARDASIAWMLLTGASTVALIASAGLLIARLVEAGSGR